MTRQMGIEPGISWLQIDNPNHQTTTQIARLLPKPPGYHPKHQTTTQITRLPQPVSFLTLNILLPIHVSLQYQIFMLLTPIYVPLIQAVLRIMFSQYFILPHNDTVTKFCPAYKLSPIVFPFRYCFADVTNCFPAYRLLPIVFPITGCCQLSLRLQAVANCLPAYGCCQLFLRVTGCVVLKLFPVQKICSNFCLVIIMRRLFSFLLP